MKKRVGIILGIVLVCILLIVLFQILNRKSLEFTVIESTSCADEELYFEQEGRDVYLDCIEEITVEKNGKKYDFKDAILRNVITLDEVFESANRSESYWDGGTVEYFYDDFKIIAYQKTFGCNDIVIGNIDMEMKEDCITK